MNLTTLKAQRVALAAEITAATTATEIDFAAVENLNTRAADLDAKIATLETAERIAAAQGTPGTPVAPEAPAAETRLSAGAQFVRSQQVADYAAKGYKGSSARVETDYTVRAIDAGDVTTDVIDALDQPRRRGLIPTLDRPLTAMDRADNQTTDAYNGSYVEEIVKPNKADFVAQGMRKPLQDFGWEEKPSQMKTVAAGAVITRQAYENPAQVAGLINGRLGYNLLEVMDSAYLQGTGLGAQPLGFFKVENRNKVVGAAGSASDGALMAIAIREGITECVVNGRLSPDTILLNEVDSARLDVARANGSTGTFVLTPNVQSGGVSTLWGKPIVTSQFVAEGTAGVGALKQGSTVWHKGGVSFYASDSHEGFFFENKIALLAETAVAIEWIRPQAQTEVTFSA